MNTNPNPATESNAPGDANTADIPGERVYNTPPIPSKSYNEAQRDQAEAGERDRVAALSPSARRREELNRYDNPEGIFSTDAVKRQAAVAELRKLLAAEATPEERQAFVDLPITEIRDAMGVKPPKLVSMLADRWDTDHEAELLSDLHDAGVSSETAQELHSWYVDKFTGALGLAANADADAMEAEFRAMAAKRGMDRSVVDALVKAHRDRLT